jgi:hypothetical protein
MGRAEDIAALRRDQLRLNALVGSQYRGSHYGGFHAILQGSTLRVTVKIFWKWLNTKPGHPDPGSPWEHAERDKYQRSAEASIMEVWSRKWKFRSGREIVEPVIVLERADESTADFTFNVHNVHGGAGLKPSEKAVDLYKNDATMSDHWDGDKREASGTAVMMNEYDRIAKLIKRESGGQDEFPVNLEKAGGRWTVAATSRAALTRLGNALEALSPRAYKPPLILNTASGSGTKAQGQARAVDDFLSRLVRRYPIRANARTTSRKFRVPFSSHSSTGSATIALPAFGSPEYLASRRDWFFRYRVVDHEFGHCLGLPDEYMDNYGGSIGTASHDSWRALCGRAGVPANIVSTGPGGKNRSIMSCGWVTNACHYVTLWDALSRETGKDWEIIRGTETDTI